MSKISKFALCLLCGSSCLVYGGEGPEYHSSSSAITITQDGDGPARYHSEEKVNNNGEKTEKSDQGIIVVEANGDLKVIPDSKDKKDSEKPCFLNSPKDHAAPIPPARPEGIPPRPRPMDMQDDFFDGNFIKSIGDDFFGFHENEENPGKMQAIKVTVDKYQKIFASRVINMMQQEMMKFQRPPRHFPQPDANIEQIKKFEMGRYNHNLARIVKIIYAIGKQTRDEFNQEMASIR